MKRRCTGMFMNQGPVLQAALDLKTATVGDALNE
jgi:hypothetical protein